MTPKQRAVLDAIKALTVDGVCPSVEEIRAHCGLVSKGQVFNRLKALEAQGVIVRPSCPSGRSRARSYHLVSYDGEITDDVLDALPRHQLWSLHARVWSRLESMAA